MTKPMNAVISVLMDSLDRSFNRVSWHGPNLRSSVRGLTLEEAIFRPSPRRHNIWEHVVHAAYWKYVVRRRLAGAKRGSFPLKGSNWFERPAGKNLQAQWASDLTLLDDMHRELREAVRVLPPAKLTSKVGGNQTVQWLIMGAAAHDLYHAGQINLLKRMTRDIAK